MYSRPSPLSKNDSTCLKNQGLNQRPWKLKTNNVVRSQPKLRLSEINLISMSHWQISARHKCDTGTIEKNRTKLNLTIRCSSMALQGSLLPWSPAPARETLKKLNTFLKWIQQALDFQVSSRLDWRDPACSSRPCFRSWRRRGSRWRRGTPRSRCRGLSKLPAQKSEEKITAMLFSNSTTISALPWGLRVTSLDPSHHLSNKLFCVAPNEGWAIRMRLSAGIS